MRFISAVKPAGLEINTSRLLNAYNYLEAITYIFGRAEDTEDAGAAGGGAGGAAAKATHTPSIAEFATHTYLWQVIINNLQCLTRDFTSQESVKSIKEALFPGGHRGDEAWYNHDRNILAHIVNFPKFYEENVVTGGILTYIAGEVPKLLGPIKAYLMATLKLTDDQITPKFADPISSVGFSRESHLHYLLSSGSLEGISIASIKAGKAGAKKLGKAVAEKAGDDETELEQSLLTNGLRVFAHKNIFKAIFGAKDRASHYSIEDAALYNTLLQCIGNNLREIRELPDYEEKSEFYSTIASELVDHRNNVAHSKTLVFPSMSVINWAAYSIEPAYGKILFDTFPKYIKEYFTEFNAGLSPIHRAEGAGASKKTKEKDSSDDDLSAAITPTKPKAVGHPKKSSSKLKALQIAGALAPISERELNELLKQLSETVKEIVCYPNKERQKELSNIFISKCLKPYNNGETNLSLSVEASLRGILSDPEFNIFQRVKIYKLPIRETTGLKIQFTLSQDEARAALRKIDNLEYEYVDPLFFLCCLRNNIIGEIFQERSMLIKALECSVEDFVYLLDYNSDEFYKLINSNPQLFKPYLKKELKLSATYSNVKDWLKGDKLEKLYMSFLEKTYHSRNQQIFSKMLEIMGYEVDTDKLIKILEFLEYDSRPARYFIDKEKFFRAESPETADKYKIASMIILFLYRGFASLPANYLEKFYTPSLLEKNEEGLSIFGEILTQFSKIKTEIIIKQLKTIFLGLLDCLSLIPGFGDILLNDCVEYSHLFGYSSKQEIVGGLNHLRQTTEARHQKYGLFELNEEGNIIPVPPAADTSGAAGAGAGRPVEETEVPNNPEQTRKILGKLLVIAAMDGKLGEVNELLAAGAPVDHVEGSGLTALVAASLDGHIDVVRALVEAGASLKNYSGAALTPLMVANDGGHTELADYLTSLTGESGEGAAEFKSG